MTTPHKKSGRFQPGVSGNAKGRPRGAGEIGKLRASIATHLPKIIKAMVDRALDGDATAARILLERALPALKPVENSVTITMPKGAGLTEQGAAIVSAIAAGQLSPTQGAAMLGGLGVMARIKELDVLEARIAALEAGGNVES